MPEEDSGAGEMQQAQEVVDMTFPARDETTRVTSSRANGSASLFCPGERGVDEGSGQIDLAAVSQVFGESLEQDLKASGSLPQLKATRAGLIRRIAAADRATERPCARPRGRPTAYR